MVSSLYFLDEKKVFTYPSLRQLDITTGVGERNGSESWYAYRHKCKLLDGKAKEKNACSHLCINGGIEKQAEQMKHCFPQNMNINRNRFDSSLHFMFLILASLS
tara:strand:+ start:359 stop:670 length:312 start_codon:yes stop_codon:yes gene_type:complete